MNACPNLTTWPLGWRPRLPGVIDLCENGFHEQEGVDARKTRARCHRGRRTAADGLQFRVERVPEPLPGQPLNVVAAFCRCSTPQSGWVGTTSKSPHSRPRVEPHDLELTPAQVAEIRNADAVLYIPGFQPAVDAAIAASARQGDRCHQRHHLACGRARVGRCQWCPSDATDPHIWLNPANMTTIGKNIETALANQDPSAAPALATGEQSLTSKMSALSDEFATGLKSCRIKDLVVSHEAFAYLAGAYGFTQVGISGLSPDAEPSPARVKGLRHRQGQGASRPCTTRRWSTPRWPRRSPGDRRDGRGAGSARRTRPGSSR